MNCKRASHANSITYHHGYVAEINVSKHTIKKFTTQSGHTAKTIRGLLADIAEKVSVQVLTLSQDQIILSYEITESILGQGRHIRGNSGANEAEGGKSCEGPHADTR